jgi:hypothetical protein
MPSVSVRVAEPMVGATPSAAPLPATAIPPQGMQGMPIIQNITTNSANPMASPMAVGQPVPSGVAEVTAASQAASRERIDTLQKEKVGEEAATSVTEIGNDEALLADMQQTIKRQTDEVSRKVTKSAFKFAYKNTNWINRETAPEAETFFTVKVPQVLSDELSKILNDALGLAEPTA